MQFSCLFLAGCGAGSLQNTNVVAEAQPEKRAPALNQNSSVSSIIEQTEESNGIPKGLLKAMAEVESGCMPYSVNSRHRSLRFKTITEAVNVINQNVKKKYFNMSVGCMQIHYKTHRKNFQTVDSMLDCRENVAYAARLLKKLYNQYGSWEMAVKRYHSTNPKRSERYYKKVLAKYGKDHIG